MSKGSDSKFFRQISHPRNNLTLSDEAIDYLKSKGKAIPPINPDALHRELLNYVDPYDTGLDIGNKEIRHSLNKKKRNALFFSNTKKPADYDCDPISRRLWNRFQYNTQSEINKNKFNPTIAYKHCLQEKLYYYTSNPFSPIRLLGTDIDNHTPDPEAIVPFLNFFQSYYPNCFYDRGSSGKSLHYYIKMDMVPLYHYYTQHPETTDSWAKYANNLICQTGHIFKIYGHNILCPDYNLIQKKTRHGTIQEDKLYHTEFDAFKGTYPEYKFYIDKQGQSVITEMLKTGTLHKLPLINNLDTFKLFINASIYSILDHLSFSVFILSLILHSGSYSQKDLKTLTVALKAIEPVLTSHDILLPSQAKNIVPSSDPVLITNEEERSIKKLCIYTGTSSNSADSSTEPDAYLRSRKYLYECYLKYISMEGREPTKEEYQKEYRCDVGTGIENQEDINRLNYIYDKFIDKMRTYTFGSLSEKINIIQSKIPLTQDEINSRSTYHRKLTPLDLAIAALWVSLCLTNTDYLEKKQWYSLHKSEHFSRELTVPMVSLGKFFLCLKDKGISPTGCNSHKAKALRELLVDIGWIQCVDDTVIVAAQNKDQGGRSRRYILLPEHPQYQKFKQVVGTERIEYWKSFRIEQIQRREQKGSRGNRKSAS